jgi:hypothetical protein
VPAKRTAGAQPAPLAHSSQHLTRGMTMRRCCIPTTILATLLSLMLCSCMPELMEPPLLNQHDNEIIQVHELRERPSGEIYNDAREWIFDNFTSELDLIEYEFRNQGTIVANGEIQLSFKGPVAHYGIPDETQLTFIPFKMKISIENTRLHVRFYDIRVRYPSYDYQGRNSSGVKYQYQMDQIKPGLDNLGQALAAYLNQ